MTDIKLNWQPKDLRNDIVQLQPLAENDFEKLYEVASDPLIWEQHPSADRYQKNVFQDFFADALTSKTAFIIIDKICGKPIGSTRFYDYDEVQKTVAIGFTFLARQYWGSKYNPAVKELMLEYAFEYVDKVFLHIGATNIRSQIATLRLGAVKTNEFYTPSGEGQRLSSEYTIHKVDWKKQN
jgi:RimJ/RimL family protein N-acetyltransferase